MHLHAILQPRGAGVRFRKVDVALAIREFKCRRPKLKSQERGEIILGHVNYVFIHESVTRCVKQCQVTRGIVDLICYKKWIGKQNMADLQH